MSAQGSSDPAAIEIQRYFDDFHSQEVSNTEFYFSSSGRFRLEFTRTGTHAVPLQDNNNSGIPDYVEIAAEYADSSYNYMVTELGFVDFVNPLIPYRIEFRRINAYGFTQVSGTTTFVVIHSTFDGFPHNDDPDGNQLGALKVTIAHELKHAIQYETSRWQGNTGTVAWLEMDATMMEEIVFSTVNDYYNYIDYCLSGSSGCSIFRDPNTSTPVAYTHVTWSLYYAEQFGIDFWVDVWNDIRLNPVGSIMTNVIEQNLASRGYNYDEEFVRNHLFHFASGNNHVPGYGFSAAIDYPTPALVNESIIIDEERSFFDLINRRAAKYVIMEKSSPLVGNIQLNAEFGFGSLGVGLLAWKTDGTVETQIQIASGNSVSGSLILTSDLLWEEVDRIGVVFVSPRNTDMNVSYRISALQLPDVVTLFPNYPNPFNSNTIISFSLPDEKSVELNIYDIQGRKIAQVVNGVLGAGFYSIPFDSRGLASGVYIYGLITEKGIETGKMVLIK